MFGRFIPDFGRVVAQMQYDMYHHYTVDEHTIRAIGILHRIEHGRADGRAADRHRGGASGAVAPRALCRGAAARHRQGARRRPLASSAPRSPQRLCPRLGLSDEETETVAWLVRYHLLMSNTAFKRDIDDPQTIADFVALVQSPERLRLLLVLTVADIRAVGPKIWNGWKAAAAARALSRAPRSSSPAASSARAARSAPPRPGRAARRAGRLERRGHRAPISPAAPPPTGWRSTPRRWPATPGWCAEAEARRAAPLAIETRVDRRRGVTEVTIYAADHPGLFSDARRRHRACRRQHRRRPHLHADQRHGARHASGCRTPRAARSSAPTGSARLAVTIEQVIGDPPAN